jgi:hypothetical protein
MKSITAHIVQKLRYDAPAGVTAGELRATINRVDSAPAVDTAGVAFAVQVVTGDSVTFTGPANGDYTVTVQRFDSNNAPFGDAVTSSVGVVVQDAIGVPSTVVVSVA